MADLLIQNKIDINRRDHFYRLAVQQRRLIYPLLHGFSSGGCKKSRPAHNFDPLYVPVSPDSGHQTNSSELAGLLASGLLRRRVSNGGLYALRRTQRRYRSRPLRSPQTNFRNSRKPMLSAGIPEYVSILHRR
jgi:hypothetical protein